MRTTQLNNLLHWTTLKVKNEKNDIVTSIYSEAVVPTRKRNFFYHNMIDFVNRLELNDKKYQ